MSIIVFQHGDQATLGRLGATLRDHGHRLDVRRVDRDPESIPTDFDDVSGVISLGGSQNVDEPHAWMRPELDFIRGAHERELPVIGVCLGAQLIAKALGGTVEKMPEPEVGFVRVDVTVPGQTDAMLAGVPWTHRAFQFHSCAITKAPAGAAVLASSEDAPVQIFSAGLRTYGFQMHFEADRKIISGLCEADSQALVAAKKTRQVVEVEADEHYERSALIAGRLCVNLATLCFPFERMLAS